MPQLPHIQYHSVINNVVKSRRLVVVTTAGPDEVNRDLELSSCEETLLVMGLLFITVERLLPRGITL